jgi:3alpha(or 20beta)-hydroxysteroid dehydrogenase
MAATRELDGRVALVTGGGQGIGRAVAARLLADGAQVITTGRKPEPAEPLDGAVYVQADQSIDADWARVMAVIHDRFDRLDICVVNGGVAGGIPIREMTLEQFRALNSVNLKGPFLGLKHAAEAFRRHGEGGSVVLMGSIVGMVGVPDHTHYAAAKDGLRLMAKAAALELGPENIRVNSVHPGMTRTPMTAHFPEQQLAAAIPLGRFGEPAEVAGVVAYAASSRSAFMTGAELVVDGGWIAR